MFDVFYTSVHTLAVRDYSAQQVAAWAPAGLDPQTWADVATLGGERVRRPVLREGEFENALMRKALEEGPQRIFYRLCSVCFPGGAASGHFSLEISTL